MFYEFLFYEFLFYEFLFYEFLSYEFLHYEFLFYRFLFLWVFVFMSFCFMSFCIMRFCILWLFVLWIRVYWFLFYDLILVITLDSLLVYFEARNDAEKRLLSCSVPQRAFSDRKAECSSSSAKPRQQSHSRPVKKWKQALCLTFPRYIFTMQTCFCELVCIWPC